MTHIIGIGGIFFKARDSKQLSAWYQAHLGIPVADGSAMFKWHAPGNNEQEQLTVWSVFQHDTKYFEPGTASFMINYIVDDLDKVLEDLRSEGIQVDDRVEAHDYGRFGWAIDPEGNRFELWEPPTAKKDAK